MPVVPKICSSGVLVNYYSNILPKIKKNIPLSSNEIRILRRASSIYAERTAKSVGELSGRVQTNLSKK